MIKAVLFDLDGTLLNTLADLQGSVNAALTQYGLPTLTLDGVRTRVGNGIYKLIARSVPDGTPADTVDAVFAAFRAHYAAHYRDKTVPYDGILPLLRELKQRGIKLAVVSNKAYPLACGVCAHCLGDLPDAVYGESEVYPKKPDPKMALDALSLFGVSKDEVLYVGDSDVDCKTAENAGLFSVSVLWGFRSEADLRAAGATRFVRTPAELLSYLS